MRYLCILNTRRPTLVALMLLTAASFLALATCNDDGGTKPDQTKPTARLTSMSTCKGGDIQPLYASASECSQDCLEYWFDDDNTLHVKHINAGFNCCIDSVVVSLDIRGQVALITETEAMQTGCHCLCLYDLEYEITNLPTTVTKIEIAEPYANPDNWPGDEPLCCSFAQVGTDTGSCCVERCHYPWDISEPPQIIVISQSGCKGQGASAQDSVFECVEWKLNRDNTLDVKHRNAFFNCCLDSFIVGMGISNDTITIVESESGGMPCDCLCRYDLHVVLTNIVPGTYVFAIRYGVWDEGIPKLTWTVNLLEDPTGMHCEPH